MPAMHTQLWQIILVVQMLLSKVRIETNCSFKFYFYRIGHHDLFEKMAKEEFEHANKFMEYQNKRGGTVVLLDIKV
jgi:hypothetical protein